MSFIYDKKVAEEMEVIMARTSTKNQNTTSNNQNSNGGLQLHDQIGHSAGQIYNYLSNNGEAAFSKIKKELDLSSNFADLGLGWLAREDKVEISKKGASVNVRLK
jgi:hypothetical protein